MTTPNVIAASDFLKAMVLVRLRSEFIAKDRTERRADPGADEVRQRVELDARIAHSAVVRRDRHHGASGDKDEHEGQGEPEHDNAVRRM